MTPPTPAQLRQLIRTLAPDWSDREIRQLRYLPGGYSNHNYSFQVDNARYVIRVPARVARQSVRQREAQFYQHFQSGSDYHGIPSLIALDSNTGAMISRWCEGPLLIDRAVTPAQLISYLRQLHQNLPPSSHQYNPVAVSLGYLNRGKPDVDIVATAEQLPWNPQHSIACHNDLNPWNVIFCEPQPWLTLDWEWFGNNDPLFDLITLHQGLSWEVNSLEDMASSLLGEKVSKARLHSNLQAFWLREYAWAHAAIEDGSQRSEIIDQKNLAGERFRSLPI